MNEAFKLLMMAITSAPIFSFPFPNFNKQYIIETDASAIAVGGILCEKHLDDKIRPICFASRAMNLAEKTNAC